MLIIKIILEIGTTTKNNKKGEVKKKINCKEKIRGWEQKKKKKIIIKIDSKDKVLTTNTDEKLARGWITINPGLFEN